MAFTHAQFQAVRSFLYHLTARKNVQRIRRTHRLESAASLMSAAGRADLGLQKRTTSQEIVVEGEIVSIRDQHPLHKGNIRFDRDWSFDELINDLNMRVFFWAGTGAGPIPYGKRHFDRYRHEEPVILRVPFATLVAHNLTATPLFCKFNSGSPRCSKGLGSIRSQNTFAPANVAAFTPGGVVEVTFLNQVILPNTTEVADSPDGPWAEFF